MKKVALVMEGGGMRGAYTAGCLAWLLKHNIQFSSHYGISTGAVHLCSYLAKEESYLYDLSTDYIADKKLVGIRPFLREGRIVGYDYLFDVVFPDIFHYDMQKVIEQAKSTSAKVGVYNLESCQVDYLEIKDVDVNMRILKGCCTLPIIGRIVEYRDKRYLDGGITDMIPIEEAVKDGNEGFLVITTKPVNYQRKPANGLLRFLMKANYPKYPKIAEDYAVRHINYVKQIDQIKSLNEEGKVVWALPSREIPVKRLSGGKENLKKLYELGYSDMEAKKEEIYRLLEIEPE